MSFLLQCLGAGTIPSVSPEQVEWRWCYVVLPWKNQPSVGLEGIARYKLHAAQAREAHTVCISRSAVFRESDQDRTEAESPAFLRR